MSSVILQKECSFFISTEPTGDPNTTVSADGSRITINLDSPLSVPAASIYSSMEVSTATIWNTSPNIGPLFNNNTLVYLIAGVTQPPIVFLVGQYSLSNINQAVSNELTNRGQDPTLFQFSGDNATQSIIIVFKATIQLDFAAANSMGSVLGYPASEGLAPDVPAPADGYSIISDYPASLNRVNAYLVLSDIVPGGIPVNNAGTGVIASIPITAAPGSQIIYAPARPTQVDLSSLRGRTKPTITFTLTDQNLRPIDTLGDAYTLLITLRFNLLISSESVPMLDF